jgi:DNA repair protein RecO (recombination protein O)
MNQRRTTAIVLTRVDYGEADRILTVLTPDAGKLSLIAKGVRRVKSKLAGGIELFSTSEISYLPGRGSVSTLVSSRLIKHYGTIVQDIDRTMLGYELLKLLHKVTEDEPEGEYYHLLEQTFLALDDTTVSVDFTRMWFSAQLIRLSGHTPNLRALADGTKLDPGNRYEFDYDATAFIASREGSGAFGANEIKLLRLIFSGNTPAVLHKVSDVAELTANIAPLILILRQLHLRV